MTKWNDADTVMLKYLHSAGWCNKKIAKEMEYSMTTILHKLEENNLKSNCKKGNAKYKDPEVMKIIKRLLQNNFSYSSIVEYLNKQLGINAKKGGISNHIKNNKKYYFRGK